MEGHRSEPRWPPHRLQCRSESVRWSEGPTPKNLQERGFARTDAGIPAQAFPGGDPASHACIRGEYTHVYETSQGLGGDREVWPCCIPVDEILSDSFRCAASPFPALFGDTDDTKIRYCSLAHPTATEPRYIPVGIPAPLQAPGLDQ
jgi:hypothetical protein